MIRTPSAIAPLLLLAACGGGVDAPGNAVVGETFAPGETRSYEGDNLTSIDAAANDASVQPLAPDVDIDAPTNENEPGNAR